MSDDYRSKLVNWLISMLMLVTSMVVSFSVGWFAVFSGIYVKGDIEWFAESASGPIGEILMVYPSIFLAVISWHLADFIERVRPSGTRMRFLTQHRLLVGFLLLLGLLLVLQSTGWFVFVGSCGVPFQILSQACVWTHPIIALPTSLLLLTLWPLSLLKIAIGLWSRLRATQ